MYTAYILNVYNSKDTSPLNAVIHSAYTFFAVYRVLISTGYDPTTDKVSVILVGQGGAETAIHDLPGEFGYSRQVSEESLESLSVSLSTA